MSVPYSAIHSADVLAVIIL